MYSGNTVSKFIEQGESPFPLAATLLKFYGLTEQPFGSSPDPRFLYLTPSHREALAALLCGIETGRGFTTLIAQPGMGKTTLLFRLLERYKGSARTAFLFQTQCDSREFLRSLLTDLESEPDHQSMTQMHKRLGEILLSEAAAGRRLVVFIDEAHDLDEPVLETVRLLSDFERPNAKLMQIVLAGQPTLADKLAAPALRQRTSIRARLEPLTPVEVERYIEHRLRVAGFTGGPLFTPDAQSLLMERSEGNPRNINNLCFHALVIGSALSRRTIDVDIIREVLADLELGVVRKEFESAAAKILEPEMPANGSLDIRSSSRVKADSVPEIFSKVPVFGKIDHRMRGIARPALPPVMRALSEVNQEHGDPSSRVAADTRKRLQSEVSGAREPSGQQVGGRVSVLNEEHPPWPTGRFYVQSTEKNQKLISDLQIALERQADETAERLREKLHVSGTRVINEIETHLAALSLASRESLTNEVKSIAQECCNQLREEVNALVFAAVHEIRSEYQKVQTHYESTLRPLDLYRMSPASFRTQSRPCRAGSSRPEAGLTATLRACVSLLLPILFVALSIFLLWLILSGSVLATGAFGRREALPASPYPARTSPEPRRSQIASRRGPRLAPPRASDCSHPITHAG
jgi:general secretion pathway protein A